ncbi:hypothetical protein Lser_V15G07334 [Lactuca serriola]
MATPPPLSPESISINSRDRLNFGDLHTIYCDCGAEIAEQKMEVARFKEEMGRDLVLSRVQSLALHRRIERTEKKFLHTYVGLISFLLLSYSSYRSSDLTEMKGSMKSVQCSCGCEAILRTSTTKYNPGRLFYAYPKKGPRDGFICWADEVESTNTTADTTLVTNLVLANKKLQSDVRKMKLWLFLSWAVFLWY